MKIISLTASNFKRLKAVEIRPDGTLQQITGRNAQGKTSVLDAIAAALAGKRAEPERPIRDGETHAEVVVDLGDIIVTRRWSKSESKLFVESKEGARFPSPQTMLDKLLGALTFDPLAFVRADAKKQAATLRELAGLDTSKIDGERVRTYETRTEKSRAHKVVQAQYEALPLVDAPDEPVVMAELLKELAQVEEGIAVYESAHARIARYRIERDRIRDVEVHGEKYKLEAIRDAVAKQEEVVREVEAKHAQAVRDTADLEARDADVVLPTKQPVLDRIAAAEQINKNVAQKQMRRRLEEALQVHAAGVDDLTKKIADLDAKKSELLAAANFPVPGLGVDGDEPTFNGIPFSQASGAEQLRVGLAVAGALNPKLRVCLVRDGSLLDSEGMKMIGAWAEEQGMQVLIERVAGDEPVGVVIEDGQVVGAEGGAA